MSDSGDRGASPAEDQAPRGSVGRAGRDLHRFSDSYGLVFALIVATLLATALVGDVRWGRALSYVLMAATLLLTFRASQVQRRRRRFVLGIVVALLAVALAAGLISDAASSRLLATVIAALFVVAASAAIVHRLRRQTAITMRTVMGALCLYLFIGLFFAVVYNGVDLVDDGPYFAQTDAATGVDFVYYSFITQATVGYGDLTPVTDLGRMLAITEALLGQVYLVTIVAALVSNLGRLRSDEGLIRRAPETEAESGVPAPGAAGEPAHAASDGPSGAPPGGLAEPPGGGV